MQSSQRTNWWVSGTTTVTLTSRWRHCVLPSYVLLFVKGGSCYYGGVLHFKAPWGDRRGGFALYKNWIELTRVEFTLKSGWVHLHAEGLDGWFGSVTIFGLHSWSKYTKLGYSRLRGWKQQDLIKFLICAAPMTEIQVPLFFIFHFHELP